MLFKPGQHEQIFQEVSDSLCQTFNAKYIFYMLERTDHTHRIAHSTNTPWQKLYVKEFVNHCHLFGTVKIAVEERKLTSSCFPWAYLQLTDKKQKYTEHCRQEYNIHNGVSWGTRFSHFIESFSIGGQKEDEGFFISIIKVQPWLRAFKLKLRETVLSEMIARKWEHPEILKWSSIDYKNPKIIGEYQSKKTYVL